MREVHFIILIKLVDGGLRVSAGKEDRCEALPAAQIEENIITAMNIIWAIFAIAGFQLSMAPTKTAVVIRWHGTNASAV